jgi:hypothetical protein
MSRVLSASALAEVRRRASPGSVSSAAMAGRSGSTFCQVMAAYVKSSNGISHTNAPAVLKSESDKLKSIELAVLLLAPDVIRKDLQKALAVDNVLFSEFAKVNYKEAQIPSAFGGMIEKDDMASQQQAHPNALVAIA